MVLGRHLKPLLSLWRGQQLKKCLLEVRRASVTTAKTQRGISRGSPWWMLMRPAWWTPLKMKRKTATTTTKLSMTE
jgi:hypothetical protein